MTKTTTAEKPAASNKPKPPGLRIWWSKREKDVSVHWDGNGASKSDGRLLLFALGEQPLFTRCGANDPPLLKELEARGYDLTTLRFSIRKKAKTDVG